MRIGLFLAYFPWFQIQEQAELAVLGDELGLDSAWISEAWGYDAVSVMSLVAERTEQIAVGSALMQIPARQPTATAMVAATLDQISNGRFRLGLGVSGPQVSEGWYGVPFSKPVTRTREYVEIVRKALERSGPLEYEGEFWSLPTSEGMGIGKPLKLLGKTVQEQIPIYLGAIGPKAVEQVGAIADGWLPFMLDPRNPDLLLDPLRRGAEKAGRQISDIDIAPCVPVAVHEDIDEARHLARPWLAFYLGAMGAKDKNFYVEIADMCGHGESARACQDAALAGDNVAAAMALTDGLIDTACVCARPGELTERLAVYKAAGADTLVAIPCGDRPALIRQLAEAQAELS